MKYICLNCLHTFDEPDHLRCPKCKSDKIQEIPKICIIPSDNEFEEYEGRKFFTKQIEYWKKRCELAEKVIVAWELDHSPSQVVEDWYNFKNSAKAGIEPDELDKEATEFAERIHRIIEKEEELTEDEKNRIIAFINLPEEVWGKLSRFAEEYTKKEDKPCQE